ncbi:MAG: Wzz/FepE/Etk N-terminal domain-containing protein [Candidatus Methylomirabilales bacterium]
MAEQEIELIDYLRVIWKRKRLIIWGTFLAAAASLVVSVSTPNVYLVSRTLRIGQLPDTGKEIESREVVIDHLKDHTMLEEAIKELQLELAPQEFADLISIDGKVNPHVRYKVESANRQMATRIADWLAENVIKAHEQIFDKAAQVAKAFEAELVARITSLEAENRRMKELLERMMHASNSDSTSTGILYASIGDRERSLTDLKRQLQQTRISSLGQRNTTLIAVGTSLRQSVKARVGLSVVLGGALALMAFTFLAFFLEYIEKARGRESAVRSEG